MAALKRNIWTLFHLLIFGGFLLLLVILYFRWQSLYEDTANYHENRTELLAQAVDSVLRTQELVLDVVGRELLNHGDPMDKQQQLPLLDTLMQVNHAIIGFGLARPDGTLVHVSSNLDIDSLPNLRTHPSTADSFQQALESNQMIMGRTYYMEAMDSLVIPIRKALRTEEGELLAVMTAGLRLDSSASVFNSVLHDTRYDQVMLIRDRDNYVQYISSDLYDSNIYAQPWATESERRANHSRFLEEMGLSASEIRAKKQAFTVEHYKNGVQYLTAALYNPRYQLWVVSETQFLPIKQAFSKEVLQYLLIYLLISGVLFALFRVIDRAEQLKTRELLYLSQHDDLTGALNRSGLLRQLSELMEKRERFSLVLINIDHFRGINDRFGQEIGDSTLVVFSRQLQEVMDDQDLLARLGSDEFAIITPNTDLDALNTSCWSLLDRLGQSFQVDRLKLQLTASIGVATFPEHGDSSSKLLRSTHLALYRAKSNRNSVSFYRTEMEMDYLRRLEVEQQLRLALSNRELHMQYQPQTDLQGRIVGLEALVRWQDKKLGFVSPAEFVEVAEQSGLMLALGRFVMDTSLREYKELCSHLASDCRIDLAINISVIQFEQPDFVDEVLKLLHEHQIPPEDLVLEVTESLVMTNFDQMLETIKRLQQEGIRLSMDDFGTGYSSLSLLRRLPLNELKIDKSFVDSMLEDDKAANMIESIIFIARSHNMDVVVEGVETQEQTEALKIMQCQRFQGYYFSRPQKMAAIQELCINQTRLPL
ncbi:putative bifunctional diguanylate cyclase/phosphodiesterase [Marinospirillum perlucidum]|uniref:putative bifunctional diguanylate cyclase/phosphodiesterase n=1 Tax=Marinospirillum perlucidum TaxID=1982602 RepID=UPI000DF16415|nr:EAL domain-containing protein [Marinospirillum perlucidum]